MREALLVYFTSKTVSLRKQVLLMVVQVIPRRCAFYRLYFSLGEVHYEPGSYRKVKVRWWP